MFWNMIVGLLVLWGISLLVLLFLYLAELAEQRRWSMERSRCPVCGEFRETMKHHREVCTSWIQQ